MIYRLLFPLIDRIDAEYAHGLAIRALKLRLPLGSGPRQADPPVLRQTAFGLDFANPIGLAAGFDKNGEAIAPLLRLGFGFIEVGTVTPLPQPGNPRPRLFRLTHDRAVINRMGFNNAGMTAMAARLRQRPTGIVGINLGKNKDQTDAAADYVAGVTALGAHADYLVINVSSPNTPGLRALQERGRLAALIARVLAARNTLKRKPPLLLKIAPDLLEEERVDIAAVAVESGLDGLIVSNTTIARPAGLEPRYAGEAGGLSGRPLLESSTALLGEMYRRTEGRLPIIGVGGVASGADAYAKIRAGASLVQLYSALVFEGPGLVHRIKNELAALLIRDGFASVGAAVGSERD